MTFLSTQNLADDHIAGLRREAAAERFQRSARAAGDMTPAAWRRWAGRGVRALSFGLGAASTRLDPTVERNRRAERSPLRV